MSHVLTAYNGVGHGSFLFGAWAPAVLRLIHYLKAHKH